MVNSVRFSVIVPVYNIETCINRCIVSIIPALRDDDEIILSLGNSIDKSNEICRQLAEKYSIIKIVHQSGKGLSNARNCASQIATGDYIIYVDGDDYVDTDELTSLLYRIRTENLSEDVIVHDFYRDDKRIGKVIPVFQIGDVPTQTGLEYLPNLLQKRQCFWNVWRFIFRRAFLLECAIKFKENTMSEDIDYMTTVFLARPSILFIHSPFYVYLVGAGNSLMDRPTPKRLSDTAEVLKCSIARLQESELPFAQLMMSRYQFEYVLNIMRISDVEKEARSSVWDSYGDWKDVLSSSQDYVVSIAAWGLHIFGLKAVSYVLHTLKYIYYKLKKITRFSLSKNPR